MLAFYISIIILLTVTSRVLYLCDLQLALATYTNLKIQTNKNSKENHRQIAYHYRYRT